ncbi:FapA family protein [Clostridium sp. BJN0001]|uniref:DUF342 domain-containing protein n=1 Tax=Clostridium sp. BJN0001 TaxID=2930219 RepID=UPI001FD2C4C8|nr:FapA family protein [Clostridium sp. BJN0001]
MTETFIGKTLEECLLKAEKKLNTPRKNFTYKIDIKRKLFKKIIKIIVDYEKEEKDLKGGKIFSKKIEQEDSVDDIKSGIEVKDQIITIFGDIDDEKSFVIKSPQNGKLYINGNLCDKSKKYSITRLDEIKYESEITEPKRNMSIRLSDDRMKAYIKIEYFLGYIYKLQDAKSGRHLALKSEKCVNKDSNKYTYDEIEKYLKDNGIVFGIIKDDFNKIAYDGADDVLIAQGIEKMDDIPSKLEYTFNINENDDLTAPSIKNTNGRIDYKNLHSIQNVEKGDLLAKVKERIEGHDGQDVYGHVIKKKTIKNRPVKVGEGCEINGDKVFATRKGRRNVKNGVLTVNNMYMVTEVNMKTGNINFVGDVQIYGNVTEGMQVKSGNTTTIGKNVESATIVSEGDIVINGNVLNSIVLAGAYDMEKKNYINTLKEYKIIIDNMTDAARKLTQYSKDKNVGRVIKLLIEKRYKNIPRLSLNIVTYNIHEGIVDSELMNIIRNRIVGINALKIRRIGELIELSKLLQNEIDFNDDVIINLNTKVGYSQNSTIKSTGDIVVTGGGQFVSKLIAFNDVKFTMKDAVSRGGVISAGGNVELKTVGSSAGVITKIEASKDSIITADVAYPNTIFSFDGKSLRLDEASRNVKAYMSKDGKIIIEKLKLE